MAMARNERIDMSPRMLPTIPSRRGARHSDSLDQLNAAAIRYRIAVGQGAGGRTLTLKNPALARTDSTSDLRRAAARDCRRHRSLPHPQDPRPRQQPGTAAPAASARRVTPDPTRSVRRTLKGTRQLVRPRTSFSSVKRGGAGPASSGTVTPAIGTR